MVMMVSMMTVSMRGADGGGEKGCFVKGGDGWMGGYGWVL